MDAPTFDTGFMAVPAAAGTVASAEPLLYLYGGFFSNPTDDPIPLIMTDTAGRQIIPTKLIPPHDTYAEGWALKPTVGLKWSGDGLNGQIWGYTSWPL